MSHLLIPENADFVKFYQVRTYSSLRSLSSHNMSFRLGLPNHFHGMLCTARVITGLTSTQQVCYLLHLLVGPAISEYMVNPLQEFSCCGHLSNLSSLLSLHFVLEPPQWPCPLRSMYRCLNQYPAQPLRALLGNMTMVTYIPRGMGRRYESRVGTELLS